MRFSALFAVFGFLIVTHPGAQSEDLILTTDEGSTAGLPPHERFVFAGELCQLQWIIRGEGRKKLEKPVGEVYRITGSTAVPMGDLTIPFDQKEAGGTTPMEVSTKFDVPRSDRPTRYLVKVWNESEEKRSLLTLIYLRAIPPATLDFLEGRTIHAVAFEKVDRNGWGTFLKNRGALIRWSDTHPETTGDSDLVFIHTTIASRDALPSGAGPTSVTVIFDANASRDEADQISETRGKRRICRTGLHTLRSLETSAASQAKLAALIDSIPLTR